MPPCGGVCGRAQVRRRRGQVCAGAGGRVCACAQGRAPSFKVWRRHRAGRRVQSVQSIGAAGAGRGCGYLSYMVWAGGASGRRWRAVNVEQGGGGAGILPGGCIGQAVQGIGAADLPGHTVTGADVYPIW